ncbi:MAG: phosphatidylglycerophosphatase A [Gammaproteobacteria bacterium]|nr:phosphatidylglycerophosphatase A [Gammaproteobacteria bacterium]
MSSWDKTVVWLATGFYTGNIPWAPGTFGTLPGLLLCFFLARLPLSASILVVLSLIALAIWIAGEAEKLLGQKDPGCIVIDEIAGMAVTLLGLPFTLQTVLAGFVLFRLFDILKPPPIRIVDKKVHGGVGIVLDDLIAGVFANLVLRIGILLVS